MYLFSQAKTPREDRQSFFDLYKKITLQELYNHTDYAVNWTKYLQGITFGKYEETDPVIVYDLSYLGKLTNIISTTQPRWATSTTNSIISKKKQSE